MNKARGFIYVITCIAVALGTAACNTDETSATALQQKEPEYDELRFLASSTPVDPKQVSVDITGIPGAGKFLEPIDEMKSVGYVAIAAFGDQCIIILSNAGVSNPGRVLTAIMTRYDQSFDWYPGALTQDQLMQFAKESQPHC